MPLVYDEMFKKVKEYIIANSKYQPYVITQAPQQSNVFPLVVIPDFDDCELVDEGLSKKEQFYELICEIEIYTMDKEIDGEIISKNIISKELTCLVNDIFDKHYGLTRRRAENAPNLDLNVNRKYMRYTGIIDENKKIYRR